MSKLIILIFFFFFHLALDIALDGEDRSDQVQVQMDPQEQQIELTNSEPTDINPGGL